MVAPYWSMPCDREGRVDCNSVWLADDIRTKIIKCSSRSVLANPGYGTLVLGAGWQTRILATKAGKLFSKRRMRVPRMKMSRPATSTAADSGSNFDAIMKVLP